MSVSRVISQDDLIIGLQVLYGRWKTIIVKGSSDMSLYSMGTSDIGCNSTVPTHVLSVQTGDDKLFQLIGLPCHSGMP